MQYFKQQVAKALAAQIDALNEQEFAAMLEYPPDPQMGDLALPCVRLSRVMRRSPVQIAAELAEKVKADCLARVEAVNGYLNFYLSLQL